MLDAFIEALLGECLRLHSGGEQLQHGGKLGTGRFEAVGTEVVIDPSVGHGTDCSLKVFVLEGRTTGQIRQPALVCAFMVGAHLVEQRGANTWRAVVLAQDHLQAVIQCVGVSGFFSSKGHVSHSVVLEYANLCGVHAGRMISENGQNAMAKAAGCGT